MTFSTTKLWQQNLLIILLKAKTFSTKYYTITSSKQKSTNIHTQESHADAL
jgi:hypothetical protein